ncbi:MAG: hypothetical protein D6B25_11740 [Desulfobulbaceae bacterium]|nr:MAG: hypothetical protein D6B25_11740 [Desulfobulbaceae bacterium]
MRDIFNRTMGMITLIGAVVFLAWYNHRAELNRFQPYITTSSPVKELVTEITGDPDITFDSALTIFHNAARVLKLSPSYLTGRHLSWQQRTQVSRSQWVIHYRRPVPQTAIRLDKLQHSTRIKSYFSHRPALTTAQILHIGRYETIPESLETLRDYIDRQGYQLSGFYEEVYLKFEQIEPDPAKYETILRYQIKKKQ